MRRERSFWVWHMGAGAVVLILLAIHMAVMHLGGPLGWFNPAGGQPVDWGNVAARARSAFFLITYILLLGTALLHGLYGLRNILFELSFSAALQRTMDSLLLAGGVALFGLGSWAAWASFVAAQGP